MMITAKLMLGAAASVLVCATGFTLQQSHQPHDYTRDLYTPGACGSYIGTSTPTEKAREMALIHQEVSLDASAATALDAGRYAEAEANARASLSLGMHSSLGEELFASALNEQGKTEDALRAYRTIADEDSVEPRDLLPYALLLLKTDHWPQAVTAYNKQLPYLTEGNLMSDNSHFSPDVPQPRGLATAIHIALGLTYGGVASWGGHMQDNKALTQFQQALTLSPDSALAHLYYGRQLQRMGRRAEAQATFKKAADLGDGDVKAAAEQALK